MEKLYRVKEVLEILNISRTTLFRRIREGKIKVVKLGYHARVSSKEVERVLKEGY